MSVPRDPPEPQSDDTNPAETSGPRGARLRQELARLRSNPMVRNAQWVMLGQGLGYAFQAGTFILLAHLLGSVQFGIYAGAFSFVSLVAPYSNLGSPAIFLRYVCPDHSRFRLYWGNILLATFTLSFVFILVLSLVGPHLSRFYSFKLILAVAMSECLCRQLALCSATVFQAFEQLRLTATLNFLTNVMRFIAVALLVHFLHTTSAAAWANATLAVSACAAVIAVSLVTARFGKPLLSPRLVAARAREGSLYAFSYSTQSIYNDIDKTMLGHFGMNAANGIYSMAYRFVDIASMPVNAVQAATSPRFFKHGAGGVSATKLFAQKIIRRTSIVGFIASVALFACAPIVPHFLGSSFNETVNALRWLWLLPLFRSFHSSAGDALSGAGRADVRLMSQLGAGIFNFSVNLYLIPHYSWRGAAWSSIATDGLLAVANWSLVFWLAKRATRIGPGTPGTALG